MSLPDPFQLLQEELKSDDPNNILMNIQRIPTVARALGPARTRSDLLPYLKGLDLRDEAHEQLAIALGNFVELVGGSKFAAAIFPCLERYCGEEETVLRDAAVGSLVKIINSMPLADIIKTVMPFLRKLVDGDWLNRVCACALMTCTHSRSSAQTQEELRKLYERLLADDTPMVRKAAFENLPGFIAVVQKEQVKELAIPALQNLTDDPSDSIRIFGVTALVALAPLFLDKAEFDTLVAPLVDAAVQDRSWRVRQELAHQLPQLSQRLGKALAVQLLPVLVTLLHDVQGEVRQDGARAIVGTCTVADAQAQMIRDVLPGLQGLVSDPKETVRAAAAEVLADVCPLIGKDASRDVIVPLVMKALADEDFAVRRNVISNVEAMSQVMGVNQMIDSVLPALLKLCTDPKWRVRLVVIGKLGFFAKKMGPQFFEAMLKVVIVNALSDPVQAIRRVACDAIVSFTDSFGVDWAVKNVCPLVAVLFDKNQNYLHRLVPLDIAARIAAKIPADAVIKSLVPVVVKACKDPVANVRCAAARSMEKILPLLDKPTAGKIFKALLTDLVADKDVDVHYYAQLVLNSSGI